MASNTTATEGTAGNTSEFPIGSRVVLSGLTKGTQYNGESGVVQSVLTDSGRQLVSIELSEGKKTLGLKPANLQYEPRTLDSLSVKELKLILNSASSAVNTAGMDKSELQSMVASKLGDSAAEGDLDQEVAKRLAEANATANQNNNINNSAAAAPANNLPDIQQRAAQLSNMSPAQLQQQAAMMKSMPPSTIRSMNPSMAHLTDDQIRMAAQQMEMMAQNPTMMKGMVDQMKNMSQEDLTNITRQQAGAGPVPSPPQPTMPTNTPNARAGNNGNITNEQIETATQNLQNLTPSQLQQQAAMMKSMTPETLRAMNPMMKHMTDEQIQMAKDQMEKMAEDEGMVKSMAESMKGMTSGDIAQMQSAMSNGGPSTSTTTSATTASSPGAGDMDLNAMSQDPMKFLQNTNPAQIKQMLQMLQKSDPAMIQGMLKSANPAMGDKITPEQIQKTLDMFGNMEEKNIERMMKVGGFAQSLKGKKGVVLLLVLALVGLLFFYAVFTYFVRSNSVVVEDAMGGSDVMSGASSSVPDVPIMEADEFGDEF